MAWRKRKFDLDSAHRNLKCKHCEQTFRFQNVLENHVKCVHKCRTCGKVVTDSDMKDHTAMHNRETEVEEEAKRKEKQFYDDFMENVIRTKKLSEYQSAEELDFCYIFDNYRNDIDDELLLVFVRHGMKIGNHFQQLDDGQIIFLLENDAISMEDAVNLIDNTTYKSKAVQLIEYFLEKNVEIKPKWIAELIDENCDGALIDRIKQKHNFTFTDIYSESKHWLHKTREDFIDAVYAHFADPEDIVESTEDNSMEINEISMVSGSGTTKHIDDYLGSCYHYDEVNDKLSIFVGDDQRKIYLGRCKEMIENKNNLPKLIKKYHHAIKEYDKANEIVQEMFAEINAVTHREDDGYRCKEYFVMEPRKSDFLFEDLYKEYLPERNHWANIVSHTYFVISKKSDKPLEEGVVPSLESLAMRKIAKEKINFDQLPPQLKRKMKKLTSKKKKI